MYSPAFILSVVLVCVLIIGLYFFASIPLTLLTIGVALIAFFYFKRENFVEFQDAKVAELRKRLESVFPESAQVKIAGSDESFTLNKQKIFLCIKDKEGKYYDDNSLMYVLLHEYAHVLNDEVDSEHEHKPKFRAIFADLLERAAAAGIYNPSIPMVQNYCGYT